MERNLLIACPYADLDDTLYPLSLGIAAECRKNIGGIFLSLPILHFVSICIRVFQSLELLTEMICFRLHGRKAWNRSKQNQ